MLLKMTEFRKVQQLLDDVRSLILHLTCVKADSNRPFHVYGAARDQLVAMTSDLVRRGAKLEQKAIETDPNKQIYNETMCCRIKELYATIRDVVQQRLEVSEHDMEAIVTNAANSQLPRIIATSSPLVSQLSELFEVAAVVEAQSSAWNAIVAHTTDTLIERESVSRVVLEVEEKAHVKNLLLDIDASRRVARAAEDARSAAQWEAEQRRREVERHAPTITDVKSLLNSVAPLVPAALLNALRKRLWTLLCEVRANPERQGIRTLRYIPVTLEHFGHAGITGKYGCCCGTLNRLTEAVLRIVGYCPKYNTSAAHNATVVDYLKPDAPVFVLPCGTTNHEHVYVPQGFEPYSERTLVLQEPDPQTETDAWCAWHDCLDSLITDLRQ
jgi:hypothetical protein